ncbi:uncharacterized protein JCM10292_002221 [Rhodotorula paludigena]|uniref:uncharacterized protein n=1 Tax=Rhodotorula paludigena TaxID=86838 RepID=UPI003170F9D0
MQCTASTSAPARSPRRPSRRSRLARVAASATVACAALAAVAPVHAQVRGEPNDGQVMLGFWFDSADPYHDTPSIINEKLGVNVPVFQMAQSIPLPPFNYTTGAGGPAPENQIERSATDAHVFLTVYPNNGFDAITDDDFTALGKQILDYQQNLNRTVFLRYAPEMQGLWMEYGQQPVAFNQSWHNMYYLVKAVAPETIMVWAPNTPQGYPYGQTGTAYTSLSAADQALLDTNQNGVLDAGDDPFGPYYPGDDVVDWIGLSVYYKGIPSDTENTRQPEGYCSQIIRGINPESGVAIEPWYVPYCEQKPDKACMFAEMGAAYHTSDTTGISQAQLQQNWLTDCVFSETMYDTFPRIKLYMQFEYEKDETANDGSIDHRDFRVTNTTEVVASMRADISSIGTRFTWAQSRAPPPAHKSARAPPPPP